MGILVSMLNEKNLGVGKNGVKVVKITLAMAPFADKEKLKNESICEEAIKQIDLILKGE